MSWRLAKALLHLREQLKTIAPHRSTESDGSIGDERHQAEKSDHNPNAAGLVTAIDVTNDPKGGCAGSWLAEQLRLSRDPRIKYVIWSGRMFSSYTSRGVWPWTWRPYTGQNKHEHHVHISVLPAGPADDIRDWKLSPPVPAAAPVIEKEDKS